MSSVPVRRSRRAGRLPGPGPVLRRLALAVGLVTALAGLTWGTTAAAAAAGQPVIRDDEATVRVNQDGTLHVVETVRYDFGGIPTDRVERVITTREQYDATNDRVYSLSNVSIDADQPAGQATVASTDTTRTMSLRFSAAQSGPVTVTFTYDVDGAVAATADGLEVRWPVIQGFGVPIERARVQWNAPGASWLSCLAGPRGSSRPCTSSQLVDVPAPTMTQLALEPGDEMVGILGLDSGSGVAPSTDLRARWSISRAFTASGAPLAVALVVLLLGVMGAALLWWTRGRDTAHRGSVQVAPLVDVGDGTLGFAPPSGIRPGQMGTLVDERADLIDVSSTIIDLAVRNYLFVEELPRPPVGAADWRLRRRNDPGDELLPYEREVFAAIFTAGSAAGLEDTVAVSALATRLRPRLATIQALLYDDMVRQGWFAERPDAVRSRWTTSGWVLVSAGVVLTGVLAWVSTFGLVGLAVVLAGVALTAAGQVAPARTASGSRVLRELHDFRAFLTDSSSADIRSEQREELVSRIFPYALVFGLGERWAASLAAMDTDDTPDEPLYWYGAPQDWHLSDAAPVLLQLSTALTAVIGSRRLLAVD